MELLPTEMPFGEPYEGLLVSNPEITAEPLPPVEPSTKVDVFTDVDGVSAVVVSEEDELPAGARNSVLQSLTFQGTWLSQGGGPQAIGVTSMELNGVLGFPFFKRSTPLLVKPGFAVHYLSGPQASDLPPRVYDAYVQFRRLRRLGGRWWTDFSFTPGVYSDFEQSMSEAFRMSGHFGAMLNCTDRFDAVIGVAYLPYSNLRIIPFAGFLWRPTDDWKIELMVPRPKIAKRIDYQSHFIGSEELGGEMLKTVEISDWIYLSGELGGGSWAIRRLDGENDLITYRDLRLILGIERKNTQCLSYYAEVAYVFCRKFDYESATPDIHPGDSVMLRLGTTY